MLMRSKRRTLPSLNSWFALTTRRLSLSGSSCVANNVGIQGVPVATARAFYTRFSTLTNSLCSAPQPAEVQFFHTQAGPRAILFQSELFMRNCASLSVGYGHVGECALNSVIDAPDMELRNRRSTYRREEDVSSRTTTTVESSKRSRSSKTSKTSAMSTSPVVLSVSRSAPPGKSDAEKGIKHR